MKTIAAVVRERLALPWSKAKALVEQGRVTVDGAVVTDVAARVAEGAAVEVRADAPRRATGPLAREAIVHADRDLVVVDKPAGLLSVADEEGNHDTVAHHLRTLLRRVDGIDAKLGVVHRLDRETSGLMVFARNAAAQRALAALFRAHDIDRVYHALAHGDVAAATIDTPLARDRGDGLRGTRDVPGARPSVTFVKPLERLRGATLVECRLQTGRQHQIRIHLAEAGHPLLGEQVYVRDYRGPRIDAPRVMLHAHTLGFVHPRTGKAVAFSRVAPADFSGLRATLAR